MMESLCPSPEQIGLLSPTVASGLLSCPLRVAFARDSHFRTLAARPKPEAILGSASHALAEAIAKGKLDEVPESKAEQVIAATWNEFIDRARSRLEAEPLLGPVPPPSRWPFYEVKRVAATALAAEMLANRRARVAPPSADEWVEAEVELASEEPPLVGRIDRVEHTRSGVRIIDLKSTTTASRAGLEPAHEIQLFLYAALYRGATGDPPFEIGIQYFDGRRVTRAVDWKEVDELVRRVVDARDQVNQLSESQIADAPATLARPSPHNCLFCDYQPVCAPFLEQVGPLLPAYASCVVGKVVDRDRTGEFVRLAVSPESEGPPDPEAVIGVLGVPATSAPPQGNRVSVCWATRRGPSSDLRVNWLSALHIWDGDSGSNSGSDAERPTDNVSSQHGVVAGTPSGLGQPTGVQ